MNKNRTELEGAQPSAQNDLALAQPPWETSRDSENNQIAEAPETGKEAAVASSALVRPRILSFEPHGSKLVMRGYDIDENGNPTLNKKEVKAAIQYLQCWADDDLISLPRWSVETEKWEGDFPQDKLP